MSIINQTNQNKQCKVDGCTNIGKLDPNGRRYLSKGYCTKHYKRVYRHGSTELPAKKPRAMCMVKECERRSDYRLLGEHVCSLHYKRYTRHGTFELIERVAVTKDPRFWIWNGMVQRCYNPNSKAFANYGGRGIKVCDEWRNDHQAFAKYLGERPSPKHSLDRIDNDGDYEPGNVRWATSSIQNTNKRIRKDNKSGCTGVQYYKARNKWVANIRRNNSIEFLGYFVDKADAIKARKEAERKLMSELN